jgi:two-component system sensor histidine kinase YesM
MALNFLSKKKGQPKLLSSIIKTSSLCAIIIPLVVVLVFFYIIMRNVILTDINKDLTSFVNQSSSDIISSFEQIENTYYTLISDPIINMDLYQSMTNFPIDPMLKHEKINDRLLKITYYSTSWNQKLLNSILICYSKTDYNYISSIYNIQNVYIPDSEELSYIMGYWNLFHSYIKSNLRIKMILPPKPNADLLYYARDYYEINQRKFKGLIVLGISQKALAKKYQSILKYQGAIGVLYLGNGTIIASTDKKSVGRNIETIQYGNIHFSQIINDQNNFIIDITPINKLDLTSAIIIPKKPVYRVLFKKMLFYAPLSIILILIFVAASIILSRKVINSTFAA